MTLATPRAGVPPLGAATERRSGKGDERTGNPPLHGRRGNGHPRRRRPRPAHARKGGVRFGEHPRLPHRRSRNALPSYGPALINVGELRTVVSGKSLWIWQQTSTASVEKLAEDSQIIVLHVSRRYSKLGVRLVTLAYPKGVRVTFDELIENATRVLL